MFDRIICVLVRIKVRGHLVMSIIQFINLISVHFWLFKRKKRFLPYSLIQKRHRKELTVKSLKEL